MKNNIFLKSTLRQPVRSLVLFLLIAAAAFGFVLRTTEFIAVRDRIHEIAGFYRSIGFLRYQGGDFGNVQAGADIIGASRYVGFEDRRRGAEGYLHGLQSVNTFGIMAEPDFAWFTVYPERWPFAYFYAYYMGVFRTERLPEGYEMLHLRFEADNVAVGFPEHVTEGQTLILTSVIQYDENPFEALVPGERYFMRAIFLGSGADGRARNSGAASVGSAMDFLEIYPLNDGLWYVHVPYGGVDLNMPGLESLADSIERARYNHSVVWLRTTADMTAMPAVQEQFGAIVLVRGRLLEREDYLEARPVAVIHEGFAMHRGLSVGDTITVSIPQEQRVTSPHLSGFVTATGAVDMEGDMMAFLGDTFLDFSVVGNPADFAVSELELTIVGTYEKLPRASDIWLSVGNPLVSYVYIPDSLLPLGFMPVDDMQGNDSYVWDVWYSFVLNDTRDEAAFMLRYRNTLEEMDIGLYIIPSGAENFWLSAEPILQAITFNVIMFWIVLFIVFGLFAFLYLSPRRKEYAVLRALGSPARKNIRKLLVPVILLGLPSILVGAFLGWLTALNQAESTLNPLLDASAAHADISVMWLALQMALLCVLILGAVFIGVKLFAKRPVLELLQGGSAKKSGKKR